MNILYLYNQMTVKEFSSHSMYTINKMYSIYMNNKLNIEYFNRKQTDLT